MNNEWENPENAALRWIGGVGSECAGWIRAAESEKEEVRRRVKGDFPFQFASFFPGQTDINVLDVGSGMGSVVGTVLPNGKRIKLCACDPLAPLYNALAEKHGFLPCLSNVFVHGERLLDHFSCNQFDLVHMSNALDHSFAPFHVVKSMLALCKIGGVVYLYHAANEGSRATYLGLHQWNICLDENNDLLFWNPYSDMKINVTKELSSIAQFDCEAVEDKTHETCPLWVRVKITKTMEFEYIDRPKFPEYDEWLHVALYYSMIMSDKLRAEIAETSTFKPIAERVKQLHEMYSDK